MMEQWNMLWWNSGTCSGGTVNNDGEQWNI